MNIKDPNTFQINDKREGAIDNYLSYQEGFVSLYDKNILKRIKIIEEYQEEQVDIDKCSEEQCKELDAAK
jgi:hypothetical protein